MDREKILAMVSDEEAIRFNKQNIEKRKQKLLSLSLEERRELEKQYLVAVNDGIVTGEWTLEQVQDILEKKLNGWEELIKPVKLQLAVEKGLVSIDEV